MKKQLNLLVQLKIMKHYKSIWENVKPFSYPQKGADGCFNYGYRYNYRKPGQKLQKRKVYRQCRKLGFDISETWNLGDTIMRWLSDNVGGFFRECGKSYDWFDTDINSKEAVILEGLRIECYLLHLKNYLYTRNQSNYKFANFVVPRLIYFRNHHVGYPAQFNSDEEWNSILDRIIDDVKWGIDYDLFIEYFFNLWD